MPKKTKIISLNANGIRAAARKGFFLWLAQEDADVVCIQETKAQFDQLKDDPQFQPQGYHCYYVDAVKKGYSGVAVYSREKPLKVVPKLGVEEFDNEGRYLELQFEKFAVVSLYAPSGSSSDERQAAKFRFMDVFMPHLKNLKRRKKPYIICGDWNIAHREIDIKNWRGNRKNSGFLPEERAWLDELFDKEGYIDVFRELNDEADQYTWWSNRGQSWANNVGWRIDYHIASAELSGRVSNEEIYKDERFSDHAPLSISYLLDQ
ncbi:MAG: exodeoxyribonuclease III [Gammaproteobacteria bacterium]|nr:exodeoxyribonuclease III [Gammaproteobacteria bacterium]